MILPLENYHFSNGHRQNVAGESPPIKGSQMFDLADERKFFPKFSLLNKVAECFSKIAKQPRRSSLTLPYVNESDG